MYRFGDGSPLPVQENFIDTLLAAVDACVGAFSAAAELDERRDRAKSARRDAEEELRRLGQMERAVETALAPMKPSVDRLASPSSQAAARALAAARTALAPGRQALEQKLQQLAGEPRSERARERTREALAAFFERQQLPDTQWRWSWAHSGGRSSGEAHAAAGRFHASFELELDGIWRGVVRVGALVPRLHAIVSKRTILGKRKRARVSLDRAGIVSAEEDGGRQVLVLRELAARPSPGWRIVVADPERVGVTLVPIGTGARQVGQEIWLDGAEAEPYLALWTTVEGAMLAHLDERRRLRELLLGEQRLETIGDPAVLGRALLGVLGPIVRQIRTRSRVPGELAIKRDIGDGRREELYVPREQIERRFAMLPASYRRPFEDIGLGRQATAELVSSDDAVTVPEPSPRGSRPKLETAMPPPPPPPLPEAKKADGLAKLPAVPPTLPRVPLPPSPAKDAA
jgi:hypothetical protein